MRRIILENFNVREKLPLVRQNIDYIQFGTTGIHWLLKETNVIFRFAQIRINIWESGSRNGGDK